MKNFIYYTLSILIAVVLVSCGSKNEAVISKEKEVMAIHDEAMAKMDFLHNTEIKLRDKIEAMQTETDSVSPDLEKYRNALFDLVKAQEAMMDWMHQYQAPKKNDDAEKSLDYLDEQMLKIKEVSVKMNESVKTGEALLK